MTEHVVVGFDGTACTPEDRTNVTRVLEAADEAGHATVYLPGVGTKWYNHVRGGVGGRQILHRMRDALWEVSLYDNPTVWVVGYSRGGAAATAFSNLLYAAGTGPALRTKSGLDEAMDAFTARNAAALKRRALRTRLGLKRPRVAFVGCFDPVDALGLGIPGWMARGFFGSIDRRVAPNVERYFALLSLDEQRRFFQPVMQDRQGTIKMSQLWVPGCHGDIGGGEGQPIARWTLRQMLLAMKAKMLPNLDTGRPIYLANCTDATSSWFGKHRWVGRTKRRSGLGFPGEEWSSLARYWQRNGLR